MHLTIRNMVCDRCVASVRSLFEREGIELEKVDLGRVETRQKLTDRERQQISEGLEERGFELVMDRESELAEQVKVALLSYLKDLERVRKPVKLSLYISGRLHYNYSYLSKIFSDRVGETIEGYLIRLKVERVKELLDYRTMTLSEIAWQLNYSSVQYLSNQFKKVTGMTVTEYLSREKPDRQGLDNLVR